MNEAPKQREAGLIPASAVKHFEAIGLEIPYGYSIDTPSTKKQEIKNETQEDEINLDDIPF